MVRSAPPDGTTAPTRRSPTAVGLALRQSLDGAAARLAETGRTVELHPVVGNERVAPVVAAYAAAIAVLAMTALAAPLAASLLLGALLVCGVLDHEGRRSWFRGLVPRQGGRALLHWTGDDTPGEPIAMVVVPVEATRARATSHAPLMIAALGIVGTLGTFLRPFLSDAASLLLLSVAAVSGVFALAVSWLDSRGRLEPDAESGVRLAERIVAAVEGTQPARGRVVVATVGGGATFHDGLDVLLRNQAHRLSRSRTRILAWQPAPGDLAVIPREGHLLPAAAPEALLQAVAPLGLPGVSGQGAARRAGISGWSALGLQGGLDNPADVVHGLASAARLVAAAP